MGGLLQRFCVASKNCTYRESVAKLALASGLRYTASISMSYPQHLIDGIIQFKQGFKLHTELGMEPLPQGWELRALKEFNKVVRTHLKRLKFIMLFKLAFQMNLQITFVIIRRIQQEQTNISMDQLYHGDIGAVNIAGVISIMSLLQTSITELQDTFKVMCIFNKVYDAIKEKVSTVDGEQIYAHADSIDSSFQTGRASCSRRTYLGKDLKSECRCAWVYICLMVVLTLISTWLIGYALLKFYFAWYCPHGSWELQSGCLPLFQDAGKA